MIKFLEYQQDLEDSFKLDCSNEDLKTDKEAKRCYKVLKKYRKRTNEYYNYLRRNGMVREVYTMKNNKDLTILGCVLIIVAFVVMICCAVASTIHYFQNPDMTELRRLIEYPAPSIIAVVALVVAWIGKALLK